MPDWLTRYVVAGLLGVIVLDAIFRSMVKTPSGRYAVLKAWLRRIIYDVCSIVAFIALAAWIDNSKAWQVCMGALACVAFGWVWTAGILTIGGLRWVFSDKTAAPPVPEGDPIDVAPHWELSDDEVTRKIRFDTMRCRMEVISSPFDSDGEFLLSMYEESKGTWKEGYLNEGWSESAWSDYSVDDYEVRRTLAGVWEIRLTKRYWDRAFVKAEYRRAQGSRLAELPAPREWKPLSEGWAPSIETAYQRYIAHPEKGARSPT